VSPGTIILRFFFLVVLLLLFPTLFLCRRPTILSGARTRVRSTLAVATTGVDLDFSSSVEGAAAASVVVVVVMVVAAPAMPVVVVSRPPHQTRSSVWSLSVYVALGESVPPPLPKVTDVTPLAHQRPSLYTC